MDTNDYAKTIEELKTTIAQLTAEIARLALLVKRYEERDRLGRARKFGASSEKTPVERLGLFNEIEAEADVSAPEPAAEEIEVTYILSNAQKRCEGIRRVPPELSGT